MLIELTWIREAVRKFSAIILKLVPDRKRTDGSVIDLTPFDPIELINLPPVETPVEPTGLTPVNQPVKKANRYDHRRGFDVEQAGQWFFRRDILDDLDNYFHYINRLKKHDAEAYELYRQTGAALLPPKAFTSVQEFDFRRIISFGAISMFTNRERDNWFYPRLGYFRLMSKIPFTVERLPQDKHIFNVTLFMADNGKKKSKYGGSPCEYWVAVDQHWNIRLMRELSSEGQKLRATTEIGKRRMRRTGGSLTREVTHFVVKYPGWMASFTREWAKHCKLDETPETPERLARWAFLLIYNSYLDANLGVRVEVENQRGDVGVFSVDLLRTPYFFKDRIKVKTPGGITKRIFHIVRTHDRANGAIVHSHFRGLRDFAWNGYKVHVGVSEAHGINPLDVDIAAESYASDEATTTSTIGSKEFGRGMKVLFADKKQLGKIDWKWEEAQAPKTPDL